jgi:Asp-tRNA(Asn)/Glu-tRNA(Gln) amidotransferase A subunit family amidase
MNVAVTAGAAVLDGQTVPEIVGAVRTRQISATELTEVSLARAERDAADLGSFTEILQARARENAGAIDRAARDGDELGPLAGVPVSIKDAIWLEGARATNGSLALRDFVPSESSASVSRLEDAGAIIIGKTNNPEFCLFGYTDGPLLGPARNPFDHALTAGGSSGGAAASVASGATPLALGTDGGGSIRGPASFCGVVGHKPSAGLVPSQPSFDVWPTLSVDGPLGRSVLDVAMMLAALVGPDRRDNAAVPAAPRDYIAAALRPQELLPEPVVAWSTDLGFASVDPQVRGVFLGAIAELEGAGLRLVEAHPGAGDPTELWTDIAICEGFAALGPLLAEWESAMWPGVGQIIRAGDRPAAFYLEAQARRRRFSRTWAEFFETYDVLLTPMMQVPPFPIGVSGPTEIDGRQVDPFFDDWSNLCYAANLTGQPAASVPMGYTDNHLPAGLQVIGPRFRDDLVLAFSSLVEAVTNRARLRPGESATRRGR